MSAHDLFLGMPGFGHSALPCARDLCRPTPVVSPDETNARVGELFDQHRELISIPVVDDDRVRGLIKRHTFQSEMAKPFRKELHERKSCVAFMDARPLVVESDTSVERLASLVAESGTNALSDGFLVARDGKFLGIGFGLDLMRVVADLQEAKNRQIMQSIEYASVIQRAMLRTSQETLQTELPGAAIIWEPRDTIGGDFFHCSKFDNGVFVALADCTGHGVPGAFMTLISASWLAQALERDGPSDPAQLLGTLNRKVKQSLGQIGARVPGEQSDDGLDALFLWFNRRDHTLTYAGARIALHHMRADAQTVVSHETDRVGIGYVATPLDHRWQNRSVAVQQGDLICAATDGLGDQIGGPRNIAFGKRRLRDLLFAHRAGSAAACAASILRTHREYQGRQRRRDDLTLFTLRA